MATFNDLSDIRRADIIDAEELLELLDELEGMLDDPAGDPGQVNEGDDEPALDDDQQATLRELRKVREELEAAKDDGALIADSYFEDYARQLAEDIGAIDPKAGWPVNQIDWRAAAEALQTDYTSIEIDGCTFWYRA